MSIDKQESKVYEKNGAWYCRYQVHGIRQHRKCYGAKNKNDALNMRASFMHKLQQEINGVVPKEVKNVYYPKLKELYLDYAKTNNRSYRNQVYYVKWLGEYFDNGKPMNKLLPKDIEKFKTYLVENRHLKNSSVNRYLEILKKMFNLAKVNNLLDVNPVKNVEELLENNHKIRFLTKDEEIRLFESIDTVAPHIKPIVVTALQTGMRRGEILNLKWDEIDFEVGFIEILYTKSGKSRQIPISPVLRDTLSALPKVSEYVFVNPRTNKPYTDIKKSWSSVKKHAQIDNFRFHDLRHTVATRMTENGIEIPVVQEILGHVKIETTMRYAHPVPERKKAAIDVLNSYNSQIQKGAIK